ncbi:MAG: TIGR03668 family PPOX class F420-dependent oxidoreductase, partial [Chloroflexota bacterium]|nr:TIGR03668 family PPOX class F420-dependent oxidoreductase [Chloroflexota bacterium]
MTGPVGEKREALSEAQMATLRAARVARFGTADKEGRPAVVPVCFVAYAQRIYIALDKKPKSVDARKLKRVRNIEENPHVSLLVDTYSERWSRLSYLMLRGRARLEDIGSTEHESVIALLREKYPQYKEMDIDGQPLICMDVDSAYDWRGADTQVEMPTRMSADFVDLAKGRHVVRQYKDIEVPRELVEETLEAARWAPSPHGIQPWRFVVITRHEWKEKLAGEMAVDWRHNLEMDGESAEIVESRLRKSQARILGSPVLVVPCLYMAQSHVYPDPARQEAERIMAIQSLGAAIQNMLLSAYSLGLDTGWMCAPLFCPEVVRSALDLPAELEPHALINM